MLKVNLTRNILMVNWLFQHCNLVIMPFIFMPTVYHAVMDAIVPDGGMPIDCRGCILYTTLFPCNECAKLIIKCQIKEVVIFSDKYKDREYTEASKCLLNKCGITYR